jgi:hypothetical protein
VRHEHTDNRFLPAPLVESTVPEGDGLKGHR